MENEVFGERQVEAEVDQLLDRHVRSQQPPDAFDVNYFALKSFSRPPLSIHVQ